MKTAELERCGPAPRTDADIAHDVETGLGWNNREPAGAIKVTVAAGWVTLSGRVKSPLQKQVAADSLRYLLGVTGVSDRITIDDHRVEAIHHETPRR